MVEEHKGLSKEYKKREQKIKGILEGYYGAIVSELGEHQIVIRTLVSYRGYGINICINGGCIIITKDEGVNRYGVYENRFGNEINYKGGYQDDYEEDILKIVIDELNGVLKGYRESLINTNIELTELEGILISINKEYSNIEGKIRYKVNEGESKGIYELTIENEEIKIELSKEKLNIEDKKLVRGERAKGLVSKVEDDWLRYMDKVRE